MGGDANQSLFQRALPVSLPKVEAWRVRPPAPERRGVEDNLYEKFGYNDIDEVWQPTTTYARWVQPSQEELAKQVEFDLPLESKMWLDKVNVKRKQEGLDEITYEFFEILLDKLEKEWFDLSRHFPKRDSNMLVEDSKCTICDDGECEASNAIVFCDGCNLAVHQDCYGVPYIPEGQWLCRKCTVSPGRSVSCILCPNKEGGFKQTVNGQWAHLLCAIWINETWVSNTVFMEPIDGIESIPKQRWRLICSLCKKKAGACIQCSKGSCYTAYHVTCAQQHGLYLKLGTDSGATTTEDSGGANISYCEKHSAQALGIEEDEERKASEDFMEQGQHKRRKLLSHGSRRDSSISGIADADDSFASQPGSSRALSKGKEAESPPKKKKKRKGPKIETPIIPLYVHQRVWDYIKPLRCSKKRAFVAQAERYWSIMRRRRRGAPLLSRLHLEPWTASAGAPREATDLQREETLQLTIQLRMDLEKIRQIMELVRKREEQKLRKAHLVKQVVDAVIFPQTNLFRAVLREIQRLDARLLFYKPVSKIEVPDYHVIVKNPMDWQTMYEKLDQNAYVTAGDFQSDVNLVIHNALLYNTVDSPHGKAAIKLRNGIAPILAKLNEFDDPQSEIRRKHRRYLDTLDDAYIDQLMSLEYPLETEPPPVPSNGEVAAVPNVLSDISLLPRTGIPEIQVAGPSSVRPSLMNGGTRRLEGNIHAAPGFKAPRGPESPFGFGLEDILPQAESSTSTKIKGQKKQIGRTGKLTAAQARERSKEHNRAWRAKKKARLAAEQAERDRAAIIAAGGDPDAIFVPEATGTTDAQTTQDMLVDPPPVSHPQDFVQGPPESMSSTPKIEAEEQPLLQSPTVHFQDTHASTTAAESEQVMETNAHELSASLDADVPMLPVPSAVPEALEVTDSIPETNAVVPEAVPASTTRERSASLIGGVPRINGWGAAIDRVEPPNDHEAILLFNEGWILPEGSKRRRASSANTETSGRLLKGRKSSLPAASVSPMFAPMALPASAPLGTIPLPPLPEGSSSPDLSEAPPSGSTHRPAVDSSAAVVLQEHLDTLQPKSLQEVAGEPTSAMAADSSMPMSVDGASTTASVNNSPPLKTQLSEDPESDLSDIEEDVGSAMTKSADTVPAVEATSARFLRRLSRTKSPTIEGSSVTTATTQEAEPAAKFKVSPARALVEAEDVHVDHQIAREDADDESELSDIEGHNEVDEPASAVQNPSAINRPTTPRRGGRGRGRGSSRGRGSASARVSRSASRAVGSPTKPVSSSRARRSSRGATNTGEETDVPQEEDLRGQPLHDAIAAILESPAPAQGDVEEPAPEEKSGTAQQAPEIKQTSVRPPSSRRKSSLIKAPTKLAAVSPELDRLPPRKKPGRKPGQSKRVPRKGAASRQKNKPSITISKKTLLETYKDASIPFVLQRLGHLLPHVQFHSIDDVKDYDLVWARINKQHPYWPAEVCLDVEERGGDVPQAVLDMDPNKNVAARREASADASMVTDGDQSMTKTHKKERVVFDHYILVQWFPQDTKSTWSWIPFHPDFITQLGESKEYDIIMQLKFPTLVKKATKKVNPGEVKRIKDAYEDAFRNMQTPPPSDNEEELQEF